jgi:hypothetical protein
MPHEKREAPPPATAPVVEAVVMEYAEPVAEVVVMNKSLECVEIGSMFYILHTTCLESFNSRGQVLRL